MESKIDIIYMVAGRSSRFGGKIKQFAEVGPQGEKLIEYSIKQALPAGFSRIIFIVGNMTEKPFKEFFGNSYLGVPIEYVMQDFDYKERDKPWGTVDALCSIKNIVKNPFVICNGDDLYGENGFRMLINHLKDSKENAVIGYKLRNVLPEIGSVNRGIFQLDKDDYVLEIKEMFNISKYNLGENNVSQDNFANMNLIGMHPETINLLHDNLVNFKEIYKGDRNKECLIPTEITKLIQAKKIRMKIYPSQDKWSGITNTEDAELVRNSIKTFY